MASDPYYFVMQSPDGVRSQAFFAELFGWSFDERSTIDNAAFPGAVITSPDGPAVDVYFSFDDENDVAPAGALVESLGGRSAELSESPSGVSMRCQSPNGTRFAIGWQRPEFVEAWGQPPERSAGELGFVSFPTYDAKATASFFSTLFDWEFAEPDQAHVAAGFRHTSSPSPTVGLHPPDDDDQVALYFKVPDVEAAARRVSELGGAPGPMWNVEFGVNAACHDPCGLAFNLWRPARGYI